jgi:hypothetical protein
VREVKGVAIESLHVALTTNADRVESDINQPSPPHPILAPQSNGSERRNRIFNYLKVKFQ